MKKPKQTVLSMQELIDRTVSDLHKHMAECVNCTAGTECARSRKLERDLRAYGISQSKVKRLKYPELDNDKEK